MNATSFESTLGTGQNTLRGTTPAGRTAANQASFADGPPYTRLPGPAHIRSATSACTMTTPRSSDGNAASRCSTTGTATLYGRLAASTVGAHGSSTPVPRSRLRPAARPSACPLAWLLPMARSSVWSRAAPGPTTCSASA